MQTTIKRMTIVPILILGIAILFSNVMQAQPQRMSMEERVKILKDSLKLSDEQTTKVTKILEDQREERTSAMNKNRGNREAMQTFMQKLMKNTDEKIKAVLTEEQAKKYDNLLKDRRAQLNKRMRVRSK
jgi:Spy/CpxP family protein refolding chaperone